MNSDPNRTSQLPDSAASRGLSDEALKRRKMLLKSLCRAGVVVAASVPIKTLASSTIRLCTVSGVQSNVGSGRTGGTTASCKGNSPTFFQTPSNWGPGSPAPTDTFLAVFGSGPATPILTILTSAPASPEAVWITALLNSYKNYHAVGFEFPYTPAQVLAYYNSAEPLRTNAFNFFVMYMQGVG